MEVKPRKGHSAPSAGERLNFLKDRKHSAGLLRLRVKIWNSLYVLKLTTEDLITFFSDKNLRE